MKSLAPRPSVISESFKLNTVTQSPDEELAVYMGRVKRTAQNCTVTMEMHLIELLETNSFVVYETRGSRYH